MNWRLWMAWGTLAAWAPPAWAETQPNVLVFYVDDMGWAQPGCYGGRKVPTPHIDALAASGVRFTQGYVSACVCAPSRAALLTGRYQARTGHDANTNGAGRELLLTETTLAQRLHSAGYTTGIAGKWHLGSSSPAHLPAQRGFDFSVGSIGNLGEEGAESGFYRGSEKIPDLPGQPVTSPVYAREAAGFVEANRSKPWFLYLAFNAVHAPHVASDAWLAAVKGKGASAREEKYLALVAEMDEAVGAVMAKLRELRLEENTLVFLLSDNGGASEAAEMGGLRGRKWFVWEGGIRVSWIAAWKGRIPGGRVCEVPVIQLDIMPTALAAAGVPVQPEWNLDGVNLLPLLEGKQDSLPPRDLFFRFGVQYAVRSGDWKLVKASAAMEPMLVNLHHDPGEQLDRSGEFPERKQQLQASFDQWNATMQPPRWEDKRWAGDENRKQAKKARRKAG